MKRFQCWCEVEWADHRRFWEMVVAGAVVAAAILMAVRGWGFFGDKPPTPSKEASLWDYLFGDRLVLGAVRFFLTGVGVFVVASFAALLVAGRWASGFGREGVKTDDPTAVSIPQSRLTDALRTIERLNQDVGQARRERDDAIAVVQRLTTDLATAQTALAAAQTALAADVHNGG